MKKPLIGKNYESRRNFTIILKLQGLKESKRS